jgi:hypothetical protein
MPPFRRGTDAMSTFLHGPCFLIPVICFAMLHYPARPEVQARLPLLSAYYISRQLAAEIAHADSRAGEVPINYGRILDAYDKVPTNKDIRALETLSASGRTPPLAESVFARFILWKDNLPDDFLAADRSGISPYGLTAKTAGHRCAVMRSLNTRSTV